MSSCAPDGKAVPAPLVTPILPCKCSDCIFFYHFVVYRLILSIAVGIEHKSQKGMNEVRTAKIHKTRPFTGNMYKKALNCGVFNEYFKVSLWQFMKCNHRRDMDTIINWQLEADCQMFVLNIVELSELINEDDQLHYHRYDITTHEVH